MRSVANVATVGILLLAGACGGGDDTAAPDPTVPTSVATPSTAVTTPSDPFTIPEVIDAAYVDRVLVELNKVYGDVVRKIRATGRYERSDLDPLRAIFNDPLLESQVTQFATIVSHDPALYKQPIGDRTIAVKELLTVGPDCIYAKAVFDTSAVAADPPPVREKYIVLRPTQAGADPAHVNPTPWSMSSESTGEEITCEEH